MARGKKRKPAGKRLHKSPPTVDWRKLPRVDPRLRKDARISVRCTEAEKTAILERAAMQDLELSQFVIKCCLGRVR